MHHLLVSIFLMNRCILTTVSLFRSTGISFFDPRIPNVIRIYCVARHIGRNADHSLIPIATFVGIFCGDPEMSPTFAVRHLFYPPDGRLCKRVHPVDHRVVAPRFSRRYPHSQRFRLSLERLPFKQFIKFILD